MRIELKTAYDAFEVVAGSHGHVSFSCQKGDGHHTHIMQYRLEPSYAKELAHSLLAAVAKLEQEKQ